MHDDLTAGEALALCDEIVARARRLEELVAQAEEALGAAGDEATALHALWEIDVRWPTSAPVVMTTALRFAASILDNIDGRAFSGVDVTVALEDAREIRSTLEHATELARRRIHDRFPSVAVSSA